MFDHVKGDSESCQLGLARFKLVAAAKTIKPGTSHVPTFQTSRARFQTLLSRPPIQNLIPIPELVRRKEGNKEMQQIDKSIHK